MNAKLPKGYRVTVKREKCVDRVNYFYTPTIWLNGSIVASSITHGLCHEYREKAMELGKTYAQDHFAVNNPAC